MNREAMIEAIEEEIACLTQARDLLRASVSDRFASPSGKAAAPDARILSPDARLRIAQAQKRRWARERQLKASGSAPSTLEP